MKKRLLYSRLMITCLCISAVFLQENSYAGAREYAIDFCTDYSLDRLIKENKSDEMDLRDQYDLIDKYFADCMVRQKADTHKEATYVTQPVFFN